MSTQDPRPVYNIAPTEKGWLLVIQDEHCSVTQLFSSVASARRAVDSFVEFFPTSVDRAATHEAA